MSTRPLPALFALILTACGSGGAGWTPSAQPAAEFPWMIDEWAGRFSTEGRTTTGSCRVYILQGADGGLAVQVTGFGLQPITAGTMETNGSRCRMRAGDWSAEGAVIGEASFDLRWTRGDARGQVDLERALGPGASSTTLVIDDPDLLLIVRQVYR